MPGYTSTYCSVSRRRSFSADVANTGAKEARFGWKVAAKGELYAPEAPRSKVGMFCCLRGGTQRTGSSASSRESNSTRVGGMGSHGGCKPAREESVQMTGKSNGHSFYSAGTYQGLRKHAFIGLCSTGTRASVCM